MRILYIEDNSANVLLVRRVARAGSHEVFHYIDGEEAMRRLDGINPDLILLDIQIAGELSGLDVVRKLRAEGYTTPIVAVTAYAMVGDRERCLEAGCNDYLAKPLPIPRLLEIIDQYDPAKHATSDPTSNTEAAPDAETPKPTDTDSAAPSY